MATKKKKAAKVKKSTTKRGRKQDRNLVAGNQPHEVRTVAKKTKKKASDVKGAIQRAGHVRKDVEEALKEK